MADESRLSVIKRKGLVEHLIRTSHQPKGYQEAYGPRQRPFIRRSKTHLDSMPALRKKETIVQSGAYERSVIAPAKGKGNLFPPFFEFLKNVIVDCKMALVVFASLIQSTICIIDAFCTLLPVAINGFEAVIELCP